MKVYNQMMTISQCYLCKKAHKVFMGCSPLYSRCFKDTQYWFLHTKNSVSAVKLCSHVLFAVATLVNKVLSSTSYAQTWMVTREICTRQPFTISPTTNSTSILHNTTVVSHQHMTLNMSKLIHYILQCLNNASSVYLYCYNPCNLL